MKKGAKIKKSILVLVLLLFLVQLVACTEDFDFDVNKTYSLKDYEQVGEKVTLKKKEYGGISLSQSAFLEISKSSVYKQEKQSALNLEDNTKLQMINCQVLSKGMALEAKGKETEVSLISSDLSSYGEYVAVLSQKAILTSSGTSFSNLEPKGKGLLITEDASALLNNVSINAQDAAIESNATVSLFDSEVNAGALRFFEGASALIYNSRLFTQYGIQLTRKNSESSSPINLDLDKIKIEAEKCAPVNVVDAEFKIKIIDSKIVKEKNDIVFLKNSQGILTFSKTTAKGDINLDEFSSMTLIIKDSSDFKGSINSKNQEINTSVQIENGSTWSLTADSYIKSLVMVEENLSSIKSNGFNIYYDCECTKNFWLEDNYIDLPGGGKLIPLN